MAWFWLATFLQIVTFHYRLQPAVKILLPGYCYNCSRAKSVLQGIYCACKWPSCRFRLQMCSVDEHLGIRQTLAHLHSESIKPLALLNGDLASRHSPFSNSLRCSERHLSALEQHVSHDFFVWFHVVYILPRSNAPKLRHVHKRVTSFRPRDLILTNCSLSTSTDAHIFGQHFSIRFSSAPIQGYSKNPCIAIEPDEKWIETCPTMCASVLVDSDFTANKKLV